MSTTYPDKLYWSARITSIININSDKFFTIFISQVYALNGLIPYKLCVCRGRIPLHDSFYWPISSNGIYYTISNDPYLY